jgi:hypothetical protein
MSNAPTLDERAKFTAATLRAAGGESLELPPEWFRVAWLAEEAAPLVDELRSALSEERERAAKVCLSRSKSLREDGCWGEANEAAKCALAIRASLTGEPPALESPSEECLCMGACCKAGLLPGWHCRRESVRSVDLPSPPEGETND